MQSTLTPNTTTHPGQTPSLKPVTDAVAQEAGLLGEQAKHMWSRGTERARSAVDQVRHEAAAVNERTQHYVQERPLTSMLIALAAGAALAAALSMALRRSH